MAFYLFFFIILIGNKECHNIISTSPLGIFSRLYLAQHHIKLELGSFGFVPIYTYIIYLLYWYLVNRVKEHVLVEYINLDENFSNFYQIFMCNFIIKET